MVRAAYELVLAGQIMKQVTHTQRERQTTIYHISPESNFPQTQAHLWLSCCPVTQSCLTLWDPMNCSTPGFAILHYLPEFAQTPVHWVSNAIPPSLLLSPPFPQPSIFPSIRVFSNESTFRIRWPKYWSLIQHQSFQWMFRIDFL